MTDAQRTLYAECIAKQLEEVDMLSSIYCTPGEMQICDASVISDFNEFLQQPNAEPMSALKAHLDYTITLYVMHGKCKEKLEVRFELPHLYPLLEHAIVIIHSALLSKQKTQYFKAQIEQYIATMEQSETYVFQVLSWIQDQIDDLIKRDANELPAAQTDLAAQLCDFERLWIYSHHLKSKTKRQEIVKQSRNLELSGFSRPGKPGIICVEGLRAHTQEFWQIIKAMHWQKIFVCKSEVALGKTHGKLEKMRRFEGFKEQLFCADAENDDAVMDMSLFLKYLEAHNSAYMKKELFGLE